MMMLIFSFLFLFWEFPFCVTVTAYGTLLKLVNPLVGVSGVISAVLTVFTVFLFFNVFGLSPLCFSFSSGLWFSLWLAVSLWLSCIFLMLLGSTKKLVCFFVVSSVPVGVGLVVLIFEFISLLVRPLTLLLRLCINMISGHVLISLLGTLYMSLCWSCSLILAGKLGLIIGFFFFISFVVVLGLVCSILVFFELFVCFIQALVFCLLLLSYLQEMEGLSL